MTSSFTIKKPEISDLDPICNLLAELGYFQDKEKFAKILDIYLSSTNYEVSVAVENELIVGLIR